MADKITILDDKGNKIQVSKAAAHMNQTIKDMLTDASDGDGAPSNQEFDTLKLALDFCEHYDGNPPPDDHYHKDALNDWEKTYVAGMSHEQLLKVIKAAAFLQNQSLLLCCFRGLADKARGKVKDEIKEICCVDVSINITDQEEKEQRETLGFAST